METNTSNTATKLRLSRTYDASRKEIFDALTNPSELSKWFAPSDEFEAYVDKFEARKGGSYRIEMRHRDGNVQTCIGKIQEITPPDRLVYTWKWEGGEMGDTLVTWELLETESGTELVLIHERFPNEEAKSQHEKGWTGFMARLEEVLA